MKQTSKKIVKDVDKVGIRKCENPACDNVERQPLQFARCSKCKWVVYCCRDCQKSDWKRHKKVCLTESAQKQSAFKEQNKDISTLQFGQSQQLLTIVRYLQQYAITCPEMANTTTVDAMFVKMRVSPMSSGLELGELQLDKQEVGIVWKAIWSMELQDRDSMIRRFVQEMGNAGFASPKMGGPDFNVAMDWGAKAVHGEFCVVEYTNKGAVLLHESDDDYSTIKGYLVVGITQSVQSLLEPLNQSLPISINTAILPFKGIIICQGTVMPALAESSARMKKAARAYIETGAKVEVVQRLFSSQDNGR